MMSLSGNSNKGCDILNFEWGTNSRDTNIIEPVLCYLEKEYNLNIVRENYEMFMWKLEHINPKMVVVSNYIGTKENVLLMKRANDLGIKTVSLISEGIIWSSDPTIANDFFYGHNIKKEKIVDLLLLWSEHSKKIILDNVKEAYDYKIEISGGTGFDRYKLLSFLKKDDFLLNYNRKEKNIVGIASWGFNQIYDLKIGNMINTFYNKNEIDCLYDVRNLLNDYYGKLIKNNPNTLFILKYHPSCLYSKEKTEFVGLDKYDNTVSICTEFPISDIINISDLWISFDSTTNLEAWLLNKTTLSIIPNTSSFRHSDIINGNPCIKSYKQLEEAFTEFFSSGRLKAFDALIAERERIIKDSIGYSDGMNYKRACKYIYEEFTCKREKPKINKYFFLSIIEKLKEIRLSLIIYTQFGNLFKNVNTLRLRSKQYNVKDRIRERNKYMEVVSD